MSEDGGLGRLAQEFRSSLGSRRGGLPCREAVGEICRDYLDLLFPLFFRAGKPGGFSRTPRARRLLSRLKGRLRDQIAGALRFDARRRGGPASSGLDRKARRLVEELVRQFPDLGDLLASDLDAAYRNDPAATSYEEILLAYPCIPAITIQRLAHRLYTMGVPFLPRLMTEEMHGRTGIDIHPGASIGECFFIDHGTGVVIGETATIGRHVTLYHGVTLGAFNPLARDEQGDLRRGSKRHPDLEDHVTVYPGATILGGKTRIGHHSIIGGNVWLTHSVAPYSRVTMEDPQLVILSRAGAPALGEGI